MNDPTVIARREKAQAQLDAHHFFERLGRDIAQRLYPHQPDIVDDPIDSAIADDGRKLVAGYTVGKIYQVELATKALGRVTGDADYLVTVSCQAVRESKAGALELYDPPHRGL